MGTATIAALRRLPSSFAIRQSIGWVQRQVRTRGVQTFRETDIIEVIGRHMTQTRQRAGRAEAAFTAMTVQQAKNREFDGVFVFWPYQVGGDDEHKRRLLYNAITRARRWCTVVAQGPGMPQSAPFI
ncbi:ATP-binding domain-containing protein [Brevundimonas naejangsanensis]|uniref:ATP-binding domain-containing protein n=1 Tax=Brevundimonas naejangsanensis TaxID=588932 RepID=UPI003D00DA1B